MCISPAHVIVSGLLIFLGIIHTLNASDNCYIPPEFTHQHIYNSPIREHGNSTMSCIGVNINVSTWENDTKTRIDLARFEGPDTLTLFDTSNDNVPEDVDIRIANKTGIMLTIYNALCGNCYVYLCEIDKILNKTVEYFKVEANPIEDSYKIKYLKLVSNNKRDVSQTFNCSVIGPRRVAWEWNVTCPDNAALKSFNLVARVNTNKSLSRGINTTSRLVNSRSSNNPNICPQFLTSSVLTTENYYAVGCNISCRLILDYNGQQEQWRWLTEHVNPPPRSAFHLDDIVILIGIGAGITALILGCCITCIYGCWEGRKKRKQRAQQFLQYKNTQMINEPELKGKLTDALNSMSLARSARHSSRWGEDRDIDKEFDEEAAKQHRRRGSWGWVVRAARQLPKDEAGTPADKAEGTVLRNVDSKHKWGKLMDAIRHLPKEEVEESDVDSTVERVDKAATKSKIVGKVGRLEVVDKETNLSQSGSTGTLFESVSSGGSADKERIKDFNIAPTTEPATTPMYQLQSKMNNVLSFMSLASTSSTSEEKTKSASKKTVVPKESNIDIAVEMKHLKDTTKNVNVQSVSGGTRQHPQLDDRSTPSKHNSKPRSRLQSINSTRSITPSSVTSSRRHSNNSTILALEHINQDNMPDQANQKNNVQQGTKNETTPKPLKRTVSFEKPEKNDRKKVNRVSKGMMDAMMKRKSDK